MGYNPWGHKESEMTEHKQYIYIYISTLFCLLAKSCLTLVTPWTRASQDPLSMGFPRQKHWSGLPFLSPGDRRNSGIEPMPCVGRWIL